MNLINRKRISVTMDAEADQRRAGLRWIAALCAGALAIDVNSALLALSDAAGLRTAHGGLLRFLQTVGAPLAEASGIGAWWRETLVPTTSGPWFGIAFHIGVGLVMAVTYAALPVHRIGLRPVAGGLIYAGAVWLLNAALILPAIGEGFAGSHNLTLSGMAMFAAIHTVFFVLLAVLHDRLCRPPTFDA